MKKYCTLLFIALGLFSCENSENQKIVFMDTIKVFEEFDMKKDYDIKMEKDLKVESQLVDSIGTLLNEATNNKDEVLIMKLKKDYFIVEKVFNEKFEKLSRQYTSEVNSRLNDYLKDFGKENGYDFILGSSGQGNIMYVNEANDKTKDILEYVNSKYSK